MSSPMATVTPVVDDGGLTLVEEDDVAFTLALSREIHRLYGSYQEDGLAPTEDLWAGLDLSRRMVMMLRSTVRAGMPGLRLEVMGAQTREMLAVIFADAPSARSLGGPGKGQLAPPKISREPLDRPALPPRSVVAPAAKLAAPRRRPLRALLRPLSRSARIVRGLLFCVLAAVAIDAPITLMALFPSDLAQLAGLYVVIAAAVGFWWHKHSRAAGPLPPTARL